MALLDQFSKAKDYTITFLKWELFGLLMGAWAVCWVLMPESAVRWV